MRKVFGLALSLIAVFFALIGATTPLMLASQAADDRAYDQHFKAAAANISKTGQLSTTEPGGWRSTNGDGPLIWLSRDIPSDCHPSLVKAPSDHLVLSFWRGEWTGCYLYPSGRTTLPMSVKAHLSSGIGLSVALHGLLAACAMWGAFRMRPRTEPSLGLPRTPAD